MPDGWIDRLFQRFSLMYGNDWTNKWAGIPLPQVKDSWSEDLSFASAEQIRKALDHCKANNKFPPTCPEFVGICKAFGSAYDGQPKYLSAPRRNGDIDPQVRAEIAKFLEPGKKRDTKDWARQILKEHAAGTYRHLVGIENAKRALGLVPV